MALLTEEQQKREQEQRNANRTYIRPVYATHPTANSVTTGKFQANKLVFEGNQYDCLDMVAIDKRYAFAYGAEDEKETSIVYTEMYYEDTDEYKALLNTYDAKSIKVAYEYLVFLPAFSAFAVFSAPKYSQDLHDLFTKSDAGSIVSVTPNIHKPSWSKHPSKLYMYNVAVVGKIDQDLTAHADYSAEMERFQNPAV